MKSSYYQLYWLASITQYIIARLQYTRLRSYEGDLLKVSQRQVSSFDDIVPFEYVYRQYMEIEIAIDTENKQQSAAAAAAAAGFSGECTRL